MGTARFTRHYSRSLRECPDVIRARDERRLRYRRRVTVSSNNERPSRPADRIWPTSMMRRSASR